MTLELDTQHVIALRKALASVDRHCIDHPGQCALTDVEHKWMREVELQLWPARMR